MIWFGMFFLDCCLKDPFDENGQDSHPVFLGTADGAAAEHGLVAGQLSGFLHGGGADGRALQELLGVHGVLGPGAHGGDDEPRPVESVAVEGDHGRDGQHGQGQGLALFHAQVGRPLSGLLHGEADVGHDLAAAVDAGQTDAGVHVFKGHGLHAVQGGHLGRGVQAGQGHGRVGGRVAGDDVADDGAHVADLQGAHLAAGLGQGRGVPAHEFRLGRLAVGHARADADEPVLFGDVLEFRDLGQVDQYVAGVLAILQLQDEVRAPGDDPGLSSIGAEDRDRFGYGRRENVVLNHSCPPLCFRTRPGCRCRNSPPALEGTCQVV
jgi:hypothetical protein